MTPLWGARNGEKRSELAADSGALPTGGRMAGRGRREPAEPREQIRLGTDQAGGGPVAAHKGTAPARPLSHAPQREPEGSGPNLGQGQPVCGRGAQRPWQPVKRCDEPD